MIEVSINFILLAYKNRFCFIDEETQAEKFQFHFISIRNGKFLILGEKL